MTHHIVVLSRKSAVHKYRVKLSLYGLVQTQNDKQEKGNRRSSVPNRYRKREFLITKETGKDGY